MKTFRQFKAQLNEVFDKPYSYSMSHDKRKNMYKAKTRLKDGTQLVMKIEMESDGYWNAEFERNRAYEATGQGDAFRVFATALAIMKDFIKKEQPKQFGFVARKSDKDLEKADRPDRMGSQEKLLERMAQRFASPLGYRVESDGEYEAIYFTFTKK